MGRLGVEGKAKSQGNKDLFSLPKVDFGMESNIEDLCQYLREVGSLKIKRIRRRSSKYKLGVYIIIITT